MFPALLLIATKLVWLTTLYYKKFPSYSAEGSAWSSIGDDIDIVFLSIFYILSAILVWVIIFLCYYRKK